MIPTVIYPTPLEELRAKLTAPLLEPVYAAVLDAHETKCEQWDWQPGGPGTVLAAMDRDTDPHPHRSPIPRTREREESRHVLRTLRGGPTHRKDKQ